MKDNNVKFGVGFTTIIMMLVSVVIVTLGVLALSTANSDYSLTKKNEEFVIEYNEAKGNAIKIRAQISRALNENIPIESFVVDRKDISLSGNNIEYAVHVNEKQIIAVRLELNGRDIITKEFALKNISDWNPIKPIKVWTGD